MTRVVGMRYNLVNSQAVPPISCYIDRQSVVMGDLYDQRSVEWAKVHSTHPLFQPEYWRAAIEDERTHLTGLILADGDVVLSRACEDHAQLRHASGLAPIMSERSCTTFELVTVDGQDTGKPQRQLRINIGEDRRSPAHNGHSLVASLKSIGIGDEISVDVSLLRSPRQDEIAPFGLYVVEDVFQGALADPALARHLFELESRS